MSPPRGGDSWKWSETENQSKPFASANFHSLRISASGPPMWPMWIPNFMSRSCESRECPVRALRALEGGQIGGGPARRLDGERRAGGQRLDQLRQRQHAVAGEEPTRARLADERGRVAGAGHVRARVADLRIPNERGIDLRDVRGDATRPAEVQRVDQHRRVRPLRPRDDVRGMG